MASRSAQDAAVSAFPASPRETGWDAIPLTTGALFVNRPGLIDGCFEAIALRRRAPARALGTRPDRRDDVGQEAAILGHHELATRPYDIHGSALREGIAVG